MRFFTLLILVSAVATYVNGETTGTFFDSPFPQCVQDISTYVNDIKSKVTKINEQSNDPTSDSNSFFKLAEERKGNGFKGMLYIDAFNCCAGFTSKSVDEDYKTNTPIMSSIADDYDNLISVIISKKPIVVKNAKNKGLTHFIFEDMKKALGKLSVCLNPNEKALRARFTKASTGFKDAYGAYR